VAPAGDLMPSFRRFDVCEAWWWYAFLYHDGQDSTPYRIFGRLAKLGYNVSVVARLATLNDNARAIFQSLANRHWVEQRRHAG
jgi:hypothetical protein